MIFIAKFSRIQIFFFLAIFVSLSFIFPFAETKAQYRDHLTDKEIELVRDIQAIDYRVLVFIKAVERRFMVLDGEDKLTEKQKKRIEKDLHIWGKLPKGTQTQLYSDIDKIINETISKVEDVAEREKNSKLVPIAIHILADRAKIFVRRLEKYKNNTKNPREIALLNSAISDCKAIIKASAKVERPKEKTLRKRTKKID